MNVYNIEIVERVNEVSVGGDYVIETPTTAYTLVGTDTIGPRGPAGPAGPPGTASNVWATPVEAPDGTRTLFTVPAEYVAGTLLVFLNGLWETYVTETTTTSFTFSDAPLSGDDIKLFYRISG